MENKLLKINHDGREVNVKFSHKVVETKLNGERRCTMVQVIIWCFPGNSVEFHGVATCHPRDNFSKSIGRKLALADALKDFGRGLRKNIWQEYHRHCK